MGLIPDFQITAGDQDQTEVLRRRLLTIKVTTQTDHSADELVLELDDRDNAIALPRHGAVLDLQLGYADAELHRQGRFTVDASDPEGGEGGDRIVVRAKAADVRATLKSHRSRSFRATTLGAMVGRLAADNGLAAAVHPDLAGVVVDHLDQTGESDLHLVTRLGRRHDAIASVKGGKLIFAPQGRAVSASGAALPEIALAREELLSWRATDVDRPKAGRVRASHYDHARARLVYETAGDQDPTVTLRHVHRDAAAAKAAAHGHHRRLKRAGHGVSFETAAGRADLGAGRAVVLTGLREGVAGRWLLCAVEHTWDFSRRGARTEAKGTVDGLSADSPGDAAADYGGDDADDGGEA